MLLKPSTCCRNVPSCAYDMSLSHEGSAQVFSFVNARSFEETRSLRARHEVSRHIGKYHRNRSKPSQQDSLSKSSLRVFKLTTSNNDSDAESTSPVASSSRMSTRKESSFENYLAQDSHESACTLSDCEEADESHTSWSSSLVHDHDKKRCSASLRRVQDLRSPELQTHLLSQNRVDPFANYPAKDSRFHVSLILDHGRC